MHAFIGRLKKRIEKPKKKGCKKKLLPHKTEGGVGEGGRGGWKREDEEDDFLHLGRSFLFYTVCLLAQ